MRLVVPVFEDFEAVLYSENYYAWAVNIAVVDGSQAILTTWRLQIGAQELNISTHRSSRFLASIA